MNTNNDLDCEISYIQKFIVDFINNKIKDEVKELKKLKGKNK